MVGFFHRLIGQADGTAFQHGFRQGAVGGEVEVGEQHLPGANQAVFRGNGFFDLDNHLGPGIGLFDGGEDGGSHGHVGLVGKAAVLSGLVLHIHLMAASGQFGHARRGHAHAVLVVLNLLGYSDNHGSWLFK